MPNCNEPTSDLHDEPQWQEGHGVCRRCGLSDSNGVILGVKELRFIPQRVLRCQKTLVK